jgi:hypothetical protein
MFIDLQNLENLENILTRLARSACQNANKCILDINLTSQLDNKLTYKYCNNSNYRY